MPDRSDLLPRPCTRRLALAAAFLPLALAACQGTGTSTIEAPTAEAPARLASQTLGREDSGTPVVAYVGDTLTVVLSANATTGYAWVLADPAALAPALVVTGDAYAPGDAGSPPRVGVGGTYRLRLRAAAAGEGVVRLHYRRSFEPSTVAPADTFAVRVRVGGRR